MALVEVLVALVVMSVGLLGIAALQITSLRNNYASSLRTQATALADDIIDRMRANRSAAVPSGGGASQYATLIGDPMQTGNTRAQLDLRSWRQALQTNLPGSGTTTADGQVAVDTGTRIATITIRWGERVTDKTNATSNANAAARISPLVTFVTSTEL